MSTKKSAGAADAGRRDARRSWRVAADPDRAGLGFLSVRFFEATHDADRQRAHQRLPSRCRPIRCPQRPANREAPDFQLPDASGKMVSLSRSAATRCCSTSGRPGARRASRRCRRWRTWRAGCEKTDIRMLAVSVDDSWDAVRQFFVKGSEDGRAARHCPRTCPKSFGTEKYPESFMIDAAGRVRHYFINKRDWSQARSGRLPREPPVARPVTRVAQHRTVRVGCATVSGEKRRIARSFFERHQLELIQC